MISLPYKLLAVFALLAGVFFSGWTTQGWHRDSLEKANDQAQYETSLESERVARRADTARTERVLAAQNASAIRERDIRSVVDLVRGERNGLQRELADTQARLPSLSHQACIDRAAALSSVFDRCTGRYTDVAERADHHVNDIQTLNEGWPVQ